MYRDGSFRRAGYSVTAVCATPSLGLEWSGRDINFSSYTTAKVAAITEVLLALATVPSHGAINLTDSASALQRTDMLAIIETSTENATDLHTGSLKGVSVHSCCGFQAT